MSKVSVYLIVAESPLSGVSPNGIGNNCKIGVAADPEARMRELQTANAWPLHVFASWKLDSRAAALMVEGAVHDLLDEHCLRGEWFSCGPDACWVAIEVALGRRQKSELTEALAPVEAADFEDSAASFNAYLEKLEQVAV